MMHEGQTGPQVSLKQVTSERGTYGVGALSELRGEATILDGEVWLSYPQEDGSIRTVHGKGQDEQAALLVVAEVPTWKDVPVTEPISFEELDAELERLARRQGLDTEKALPVLIEGTFPELAYHVIDGRKLQGGGGSHTEHMRTALKGTARGAQGTLVGFFSKSHHGVFTHMGTATHLHVVLRDRQISGHVDRVTLAPGSTVRFGTPGGAPGR